LPEQNKLPVEPCDPDRLTRRQLFNTIDADAHDYLTLEELEDFMPSYVTFVRTRPCVCARCPCQSPHSRSRSWVTLCRRA
jgi:hypothetical protein